MLCSMFQHCPVLRRRCLQWMAARGNAAVPEPGDEMDWTFKTEFSVASGRLDLLIDATPEEADAPGTNPSSGLTWIVEVKVQSSFHQAPAVEQQTARGERGAGEDKQFVNQIDNYDWWLSRQEARHRAGFVLGVADLSADLPTSLDNPWTCVRWAGLGRCLEEACSEGSLSDAESFMARQMAGFIRLNLWSESTMNDEELTFDDVALVRAMSLHGQGCRDKVKELVSVACDSLEETDLGVEPPRCQRNLRISSPKLWARLELVDSGDVRIQGGVHFADFVLAVWAKPNSSLYQGVHDIVNSKFDELEQQDERWRRFEDTESEWASEWRPAEIRMPLTDLLAADDQEGAVREFVETGLHHLEEAGILDAFRNRLDR